MYLNPIWYQDAPFNACTQNLKAIQMHVCIYGSFCQCAKRRKQIRKNQENGSLFEDSYFRNCWCDLLHIWYTLYVFSPDMPAPVQRFFLSFGQKFTELQTCVKFFVSVYSCCVHMRCFLRPHEVVRLDLDAVNHITTKKIVS